FLRRRAAYVVAQRPTPDAARALWARVAGDPDPRLRAFGAEALARACLPEARKTLARLLAGDPSLSVRHAAVRGLASLGGTETERAPALADRAFQVRLAARQALSDLAAGRSECSGPGPR
ncbi:MAG: HEAT repeat domain-containing protein, partial [Candidatus Rokubacteria bacterium]|nr:HEAT repeat domain-containing protein [Candidatus Rokubacteria bacterium]